jgi:hypothetical protein
MDGGNGPAPSKRESNMNDIRELNDLSSEELDAVSGGFFWLPLLAYKAPPSSSGGEGTGGGQNDPAQMFQQILQQMTQGG